MSDSEFFAKIDGEEKGPFTQADIAELINGGKLSWETNVRHAGVEVWSTVESSPKIMEMIKTAVAEMESAASAGDASTSQAQAQEKMFCVSCGKELSAGEVFCSGCGAPTGAGSQEKVFCTNCGKELGADEAFCGNCGTPSGNKSQVNANDTNVAYNFQSSKKLTGGGLAMEIEGNYDGVSIKVKSDLFGGYVLIINGREVAKWSELISPSKKKLIIQMVNYSFNSGSKTIEVYLKAVFSSKLMLCIGGQHVGGDNL